MTVQQNDVWWFTQSVACLCMFQNLVFTVYACCFVLVCMFVHMHTCTNVLVCPPVHWFNLRPTNCDRGSMWKYYPGYLPLPSPPPTPPQPCCIFLINKLFQPILSSCCCLFMMHPLQIFHHSLGNIESGMMNYESLWHYVCACVCLKNHA